MKNKYLCLLLFNCIGWTASAQLVSAVAEVKIIPSRAVCSIYGTTLLKAQYTDIKAPNDYIGEELPNYAFIVPYDVGDQIPIPPPGCCPGNDDFWAPRNYDLPPNFNFCYYGKKRDQFTISSNGCISFRVDYPGSQANTTCPWNITEPFPSPAFPNGGDDPIRDAIFGVFQDIHFAGRDGTISYIAYKELNSGAYAAPNRACVVNINQIPQYNSSDPASVRAGLQTYQIVLHETTNVIDVNVKHRQANPNWYPRAAVIGINDSTGVKGVSIPGYNMVNFTANEKSFRFTPSGATSLVPTVKWEYLDATNTLVTVNGVDQITATAYRLTTRYTAYVTYTNCSGTQTTVKTDYDLVVGSLPAINNPKDICSAAVAAPTDPVTTADITQVANMVNTTDNPAAYTFYYYDTQAHANDGYAAGLISNPAAYPVLSLPQQLWVRVEDAIGAGCQDVRPFNLKLKPEGDFAYDATAGAYCKEVNSWFPKLDVTGQPTLTLGGIFTIFNAAGAEIPSTPSPMIDPATGAINPFGRPAGIYTVKYHLDAGSGNCNGLDLTKTFEVETCNCDVLSSTDTAATTDYTADIEVKICQNTAMTDLILKSKDSTDVITNIEISLGTLPTNITGVYDPALKEFKISGTPAATVTPQTFTVTVKITKDDGKSCTRDVNIIITGKPNAGDDKNEDICVGSTTKIDLFTKITPATGSLDLGGTWTRMDAAADTGGTLITTATTAEFDPTGTNAGKTAIFKYEVGTTNCVADTSYVKINIVAKLNPGTNAAKAACRNDSAVIDLATIIGTHAASGTWTRISSLVIPPGAFDPTAGTFIANGATVGVHKFKYTLAATATCDTISSMATVNVLPIPEATIAFVSSSTSPVLTRAVCVDEVVKIKLSVTNAPSPFLSGYKFTYTYTGLTTPIETTTVGTDTFVEITAPTGVDGDYIFTLLGVETDTAAPACANTTFTTDHVDLKVHALPVATITTSATSVCMGTATTLAPKVKIEATSGVAPFKFTYNYTGNTGLPITVTSNSGIYEITVPTTTQPATYTIDYDLLSVEDSALGTGVAGCVNTTAVPQRVSVDVKELPKAVISGTKTICYGDLKPEILFTGSSGTAPFTFSYKINGVVQTPDLTTTSGSNSVSIDADNTATTTYEITGVRDANAVSCSSPISGQIATITVNPQPVITSLTITDPSICVNEKTVIKVLPDTGYHYDWTVPAGVTAPGDVAFFDIDTSGEYKVVISDANNCKSASQSASLLVNTLPVIQIADGHICTDAAGVPLPGEIFRIESGFSVTGYSFEWFAPSGTQITNPDGSNYSNNYYDATQLGVYGIKVTNTTTPTLCANTGTATVLPSLPPSSGTYQVSNYFSETQVITIDVLPAGDYLYQLDNGYFQTSNRFFNLESGEYMVHVKDKFGCGIIDIGPIRIIDFPKFFTPNNDGYNDTWNISDLKEQLDSKIYIFNRLGKLIKEMSPAGAGWDGNYNGTAMPAEDYWFKIFFTEQGVKKEFKSHFSLKR